MKDLYARLAEALGYGDKARDISDGMVKRTMKSLRLDPKIQITEEEFNGIEKMAKNILGEYLDGIVGIYKSLFSTEELEKIVECYETPVMEKMLKMYPDIAKAQEALYVNIGTKLYTEVLKYFQDRNSADEIPINMSKN